MARHHIPLALTSFVGRSVELAALGPLVAGARLVTLTGVGGAGKTRLALTWAAQTVALYPDGVRVAELAPIRESALIPAAVAAAIGFLPGELTSGGLPLADALCAQLCERRMLVVLDNCEHLVAAVAKLAMALLSRCPGVTILVTSREVLGIPGELVFPVPPMSLPAQGTTAEEMENSDAGRLFCDRARAADPGFRLTAANCAAVQEICRRLDGIPLALELAAARMRVLSPTQVADRLGERLALLGATGRAAVPRHQTLRAAIDWSYDLLPPNEQVMLSQLSVFPGTFDLAAAEAVAASGDATSGEIFEGLEALSRLVDKSLVTVTRDAGESRFGLLETVRQYAAERLLDSDQHARARERHRNFYLEPALTSTRLLDTFATRLRIVARELDNYRAALRWSVDQGDGAAVLALGVFTGPYWLIVANDDEGWLEHAVAFPADLAPSAAAEVRCLLAMFVRDRGQSTQRYVALREESLLLARDCGDLNTTGRVSAWFSELELGAGNRDRADELRVIARAAFNVLGDGLGQAWCEHQLALIRLADDDLGAAVRHAGAAVTLMGAQADEWWAPHAFGTLAIVAALAGDHGSEGLAAEGVRIARGLPWPVLLVMALTRAAQAAVLSEAHDRARDLLSAELFPLLRDLGFHRWVGDGLELSALTLAHTAPEAAVRILGSSSALRNRLGEAQGAGVLARHIDACRVALMDEVGVDSYAEHDRQGRVLSTDAALDFARSCLLEESGRAGVISDRGSGSDFDDPQGRV